MGLRLELGQVYGAAYAAAAYARERGFRKVLCIGATGLQTELRRRGIDLCEDDREAEALVVGMDRQFDGQKLARAVRLLKRGCPAMACSRERLYPVEDGRFLLACGSIVEAIEKAGGRRIDWIVGKPNPHMLRLLCSDWDLTARELLVVGDTYGTDIVMARKFGCRSILIAKKNYKTTTVVSHVGRIGALRSALPRVSREEINPF